MFEDLIKGWLCVPDDYKKERMDFFKRLFVGATIAGVGLYLLLRYLNSPLIFWALVLVLIVGIIIDLSKRETRRKWLDDWWHGNKNPWLIIFFF